MEQVSATEWARKLCPQSLGNKMLGKLFEDFAFFAVVALVAASVTLGGCSRPPKWTTEEKQNAQFVLEALRAEREATRTQNGISGRVRKHHIIEIASQLKKAIKAAELVRDEVLNKIHPRLRARWKGQFIQGMQQRLKNLENPNGDSQAEWLGSAMLDRFGDWSYANRRDFRVPKINSRPSS